LPEETKGILGPYNFCVDIEKLAFTGSGTYLYLFYFKLIIYMLFISLCMVTIPQIYYNYVYYLDLKDFCIKPANMMNAYCADYIENDKEILKEYLKVVSFGNMHYYKNILHDNVGDLSEDITLRYNLLNFMCIIVMFVTNVAVIIDIYNNILELDYSIITPSDYTLMIKNVPRNKNKSELKMALEIVFLY
jgi:hypothetical protein